MDAVLGVMALIVGRKRGKMVEGGNLFFKYFRARRSLAAGSLASAIKVVVILVKHGPFSGKSRLSVQSACESRPRSPSLVKV